MYEYFYGVYESDDPEDTLEHHGILGMKWGIRRFQNYDGSLKAEGRKRRAEERVQKRAERKAAKAEKKAAKEEEARKKLRAEIDDAIANVDFEKLSKYKGQMTDDDLKRIADRAGNLGRTSTQLENYKKSLPPSTFDKAMKTLGAMKTGMDAVKEAYSSFNNLKKEFGLDNKSVIEAALKDKSDSGSKSGSDEPDIFDKVADLTKKIAKDAGSKAADKIKATQEKREADKLQKQLKEASDRIKDNDTLDWLKSISGSDKSDSKEPEKPKANFDSVFKLKDGDYDTATGKSVGKFIDKLGSVGDVTNKERTYNKGAYSQQQLRDSVSGKGNIDRGFRLGEGDYSLFRNASTTPVSKAGSSTGSKTIDRILKSSSAANTSIDDLNSDLLRRNGQKLGL